MNRDEVKALLETWHPGLAEADTARVAEALKQAENDPALAAWLAQWKQRQSFDAAISAHVQAIPVPRQLKAALLAAHKPVHQPFWRIDLLPYLQRTTVRWAVAACAVLLAGGGFWLSLREPVTFSRYRHEIIDDAWAANPHLAFHSSSLGQIREWLAQRQVNFQFAMPEPLRDTKVRGSSLFEWRGHPVVMLCLSDGGRHFHLFVADGIGVPDAPWEDRPDYQDAGGWKTIGWSVGERTYLLAGMKYSTFTQRVYRRGIWRMSI